MVTTPFKSQTASTGVVSHVATSGKVYAPTFDCCATCARKFGSSDKLFDHLIKEKIPATVFLTGEWMKAHPDATKKLIAAKHIEIGFHGMTHNNLRLVSNNAKLLDHEINGPKKIYQDLLAQTVRDGRLSSDDAKLREKVSVFRFPSGDYNDKAVAAVKKAGMTPVQWNATMDGSTKIGLHSKQKLEGNIALAHANMSNAAVKKTQDTFPALHADMEKRGFKAVTVSQLLKQPNAKIVYSTGPIPRTPHLDALDQRTYAENAKDNHGMGKAPQRRLAANA